VRLYLGRSERRPDPEPLRTNDRAAVLVGIATWFVLGVLAVALHGRLEDAGNGWWVWTPPVGIVLGLFGLRYLRRRDHRAGP
jgi:hypothetical protein